MDFVILQILFWSSCFLTFWTYSGYYLLLLVLSAFRPKHVRMENFTPDVAIVITAYNEENRIVRKLENCLSLDYPKEKVEIVVVSDGSSDDTVREMSYYSDRGIKPIVLPERRGKHYAQEQGVRQTTGEIIVFTDVAASLKKDALRKIVRSFADPTVGCVSGMDRIEASSDSSSGEGLYVKYEMKLRSLESRVSSLISVSGSFFAVRRRVCAIWRADLSSDFWIPLRANVEGLRAVLDTEAVGLYSVAKESPDEFSRKVRTVVHGIDVLFSFGTILNPFRHGFLSVQIISHKLFRWLVPLFLVTSLATSVWLAQSSTFYALVLAMQIVFYLAAAAAFAVNGLRRSRLFRIPFFFALANLSIVVAWLKYLSGKRFVTWERTAR